MTSTTTTASALAAVRYLLTSPSLGERCRPMFRTDGFDWPALLAEAESMSNGQRLLVRVAHDLWEADAAVGVSRLARALDARSFDRVVTALRLFRGEASPVALAEAA